MKQHQENIKVARTLMTRAAFLARAASSAKRDGDSDVVRPLIERARWIMGLARATFMLARKRAARLGQLAHKYMRDGDAWLAVVMVGDAILWRGARHYGKRQSAQRAALAMLGKLTREYLV